MLQMCPLRLVVFTQHMPGLSICTVHVLVYTLCGYLLSMPVNSYLALGLHFQLPGWLQVGSPPSDITWTPPGTAQHERSPFAGKQGDMSRVSHAPSSMLLLTSCSVWPTTLSCMICVAQPCNDSWLCGPSSSSAAWQKYPAELPALMCTAIPLCKYQPSTPPILLMARITTAVSAQVNGTSASHAALTDCSRLLIASLVMYRIAAKGICRGREGQGWT